MNDEFHIETEKNYNGIRMVWVESAARLRISQKWKISAFNCCSCLVLLFFSSSPIYFTLWWKYDLNKFRKVQKFQISVVRLFFSFFLLFFEWLVRVSFFCVRQWSYLCLFGYTEFTFRFAIVDFKFFLKCGWTKIKQKFINLK